MTLKHNGKKKEKKKKKVVVLYYSGERDLKSQRVSISRTFPYTKVAIYIYICLRERNQMSPYLDYEFLFLIARTRHRIR